MKLIVIRIISAALLATTLAVGATSQATAAPAADTYTPSRCGNNGDKVLLVFDDYPMSLEAYKKLITVAHDNGIGIGVAPNGMYVDWGRVKPGFARKRGMLVVDHTYDHQDLTTLSKKKIKWEITRPQIGSNYVRPPYGAYNDKVLSVFKKNHKLNCMWNLDPRDWDGRSPKAAARWIVKHAFKGATAVVHMNHLGTRPRLLVWIKEHLAARGLKLCPHWSKPTPVIMPNTYCS